MKPENAKKEAEIKVSQVVTKVAHLCRSDDSRPSFEGEIAGVGVQWPIAFGRFRISYCPWCGLPLPNRYK